jgi:hypothetical protein
LRGWARQVRLVALLAAAGTLLVRKTSAASPVLQAPSASDSQLATRSAYEKEDAAGPALGWNWKGTWLTPIAAPAYTPELGVLLTAGGMLSWRADADSPRSSLPFNIGYGTVGAFVYSGLLKAYFARDRYRLDLDTWVKDMTDHYFGVGYDAGRNTHQGDTTTQYHRFWWQVKPILLRRVYGNWLFGLTVDANQTNASELSAGMAADPAVVQDGSNNLNFGVGPTLRFDSRDIPQNAYRGVYFQARFVPYLSALGKHPGYQVFDLDYRHYLSVGRIGSTLTWNVVTRTARGGVPWSELGQVGSPFDLRGYRWGRYRDQTIAYAILEYRYTFSAGRLPDGSVDLSRHGLVGWVGLGTLGSDYAHLNGALPNVGLGYRFAVQGRLNARIDYGIGKDSQAFYLNFTEAY